MVEAKLEAKAENKECITSSKEDLVKAHILRKYLKFSIDNNYWSMDIIGVPHYKVSISKNQKISLQIRFHKWESFDNMYNAHITIDTGSKTEINMKLIINDNTEEIEIAYNHVLEYSSF